MKLLKLLHSIKDLDENESLELGIPVYKDKDKEDRFTLKDFLKSLSIFMVMLLVWGSLNLGWDKAKCAYIGHTYEKSTKRPIFSECLIQMKDGSYVPLERYINRVLTLNDMNGNITGEQ